MEQVLERPASMEAVDVRLTYYTSQPAPTQWIAVGVVSCGLSGEAEQHPRLVVGTGRTEAAAIAALERRVRDAGRG